MLVYTTSAAFTGPVGSASRTVQVVKGGAKMRLSQKVSVVEV